MSKAFSAKGTTTKFGPTPASGAATYNLTVAEVKTIQFGSMKSDIEDVTSMDSPSAFREKLPTLLDAGEITISGNRVPLDAGQVGLLTAYTAQQLTSFQIQLPKGPGQTTAGDSFTFNAYVTDISRDFQFDKAASFSAKLTITGPLTETEGS